MYVALSSLLPPWYLAASGSGPASLEPVFVYAPLMVAWPTKGLLESICAEDCVLCMQRGSPPPATCTVSSDLQHAVKAKTCCATILFAAWRLDQQI